eukprot:6767970-Pyramimonas_sp.AAC.2
MRLLAWSDFQFKDPRGRRGPKLHIGGPVLPDSVSATCSATMTDSGLKPPKFTYCTGVLPTGIRKSPSLGRVAE